jgi:hypothetical protein
MFLTLTQATLLTKSEYERVTTDSTTLPPILLYPIVFLKAPSQVPLDRDFPIWYTAFRILLQRFFVWQKLQITISHIFFYKNIKLWELPRQLFKQSGLEGLLPLATLMQGGAQRDVVEEIIADLQAAQKQDLLPLAYAFAALVFEETDDREWLRRPDRIDKR